MATTNVTDADFDNVVLASTTPVLVDFWAVWCNPCKLVAPILDEISESHGDKIRIVKLNVDENPATAARFGVTSIPTMNVYKAGQLVGRALAGNTKALTRYGIVLDKGATKEQVLTVLDSPLSATELGKQYGVCKSTICRIRKGITWARLTKEQKERLEKMK